MKTLVIIIALLSHPAFAKSRGSSLQKEATHSLSQYFKSSDRKIQNLKWIDLSLIDSAKQEYLLEAEVLAQKNGTSGASVFHCGVFSKKWSAQRWEVALTACESLFDVR